MERRVPISEEATREFFVSDDGVWIEPWGLQHAHCLSSFRYWHHDVAIKFDAWRPGENWINYDPTGTTERTLANFALGPVCKVWIDDRRRWLSTDEKSQVKAIITEF